jgi:hypothetical protein
MTRLLELPRELRDRIIELAISHRASAPKSPKDAGPRVELDDIDYFSPTGCHYVKYAADTPHTSPHALLQVSRQVRAETLSALSRLPLRTECDVLIVNEDELYVTWTYVPPLFATLHAFPPSDPAFPENQGKLPFGVNFTIRMHGIFEPTPLRQRSGFEDEVSGPNNDIVAPGRVICALCSLFERFLRVGPGGYPAPNRDFDRCEPVGNARLDIQTPATSAGLLPTELGPHYARQWREQNNNSRAMIHPETLVEMMTNWFWVSEMFDVKDGQPKHLGQLLERVGELCHAVDGKPKIVFHNSGFDGDWDDMRFNE